MFSPAEPVPPHEFGDGPGSDAGKSIDWLTIADREGSVVDDVGAIRNHPLVPGNIAIYGYIHDVKTGRLIEVPAATAAGEPLDEAGTSA